MVHHLPPCVGGYGHSALARRHATGAQLVEAQRGLDVEDDALWSSVQHLPLGGWHTRGGSPLAMGIVGGPLMCPNHDMDIYLYGVCYACGSEREVDEFDRQINRKIMTGNIRTENLGRLFD